MSGEELRAFRESLGLSRRKFAPMLFISEPTLVRRERGDGKLGDLQLHLLRRMRAHLGGGQPGSGFQYDVGPEAVAAELLQEKRRLIAETLRGMGIVPLEGRSSEGEQDWWLRFSVGWATGQAIEMELRCEGSERPRQPTVDFMLAATATWKDPPRLAAVLGKICRRHRIYWDVVDNGEGKLAIELCYRLFVTGFNAETVRHVIGNFGSCWKRIERALVTRPVKRGGASADGEGGASQ